MILLTDITDELRVELLEMSGRTIRVTNQKIDNQALNVSWEISSLPKGTYIVVVGGESFQRTQKIILQ